MKTIEEIRLDNLRTLCSQFKSQRQFALHIGKSPAQVNQWFVVDGKPIGSKAAREVEEVMGKPTGWLDTTHDVLGKTESDTLLSAAAKLSDKQREALVSFLQAI